MNFFDRGCGKFVQLGDLERHVADCGFAPAVCSNEGCQLEVNKQDLLHHETAVCELRRVKCHSCNDIRREMDTVKVNLTAMNVKLKKNEENVKIIEKKLDRNGNIIFDQLKRYEEKFKSVEAMVENVATKVELAQEQHNKQGEKLVTEITRQLEKITKHISGEQQTTKRIRGTDGIDEEPKLVVAGGGHGCMVHSSVEMFCLATKTWTRLQPMRDYRDGASSVVYNNQLFVAGGHMNSSVEKLSLNAVHDQSVPWEKVLAEMPGKLAGHCSIVYYGRLIVIGGWDICGGVYSDSITEISLVSPYTSKLLATMPQGRFGHGVAIFGDKILIVGGRKSHQSNSVLKVVVMYDITNNEFQELAPLPYSVHEMATVKWGDDNVMIMGGADSNNQPLNKVLMYNIKTQLIHELPDMKSKRAGCVAAVVRDTVIVMGGGDERNLAVKSVEGFRFDWYSWKILPEMHENRSRATAVVC